MEVRRSILLLLGCLVVLGGCRSSQHVATLEQELRLQEDRIYQLQDCLEETQAVLDDCRQENQSLRRSLADEGGAHGGRRGPNLPGARPRPEVPDVPTDLNIETPPESQFQEQVPDMLRGSAAPRGAKPSDGSSTLPETLDLPPGINPPSAGGETDQASPGSPPTAPDRRPRQDGPRLDATGRSEDAQRVEIAAVAVERMAPGRSGSAEEGLSLVVVPRDGRGRPVAAAAPISVVVVDPALPGASGRVARWDFSPEATAARRQPSPTGEGFRLRLRWPDGGPPHKELHLFVRYTTADGRKLHAETSFDLGRLTVAEPRPADRLLGQWQRIVAPAAPASDGPTARVSRTDHPPGRVAQGSRRPVWSPERE